MWSYSGDPASSDRDMVRFLIGDTDVGDQQLSDAEVDAMVAASSGAYPAAVRCIEVLISRFSRKVTKSVGDLSISYSDTVRQLRDLLAQLRARASIEAAAPYAGGISVSDKELQEADTDRVAPTFATGMFDYEETDTRTGE